MQQWWIKNTDLEVLPWIPPRIKVGELKQSGLVGLQHKKNPEKEPWLPKGQYKFIGHDKKLYVLEIPYSQIRGAQVCAWLYRPKVRVKSLSK